MPRYTRKEAMAKAEALKEQMARPHIWRKRVFENLGWHYAIQAGSMMVCPFEREGQPAKYFCMITDKEGQPGLGAGIWHLKAHEAFKEDPNEAVAVALREARQVVDAITRAVEQNEALVGAEYTEEGTAA